jgi:hypothetical protein
MLKSAQVRDEVEGGQEGEDRQQAATTVTRTEAVSQTKKNKCKVFWCSCKHDTDMSNI